MEKHLRDSFTDFLVAKGRRDGIVALDSDYDLGTNDVIEACAGLTAVQADACLRAAKRILRTDPRDAEIARLKAERHDISRFFEIGRLRAALATAHALIDRQARALAAGPAALRKWYDKIAGTHGEDGDEALTVDRAADEVEAAQEAAMKGGG